jgi:hypothetical protein
MTWSYHGLHQLLHYLPENYVILKLMYCKFEHNMQHEKLPDRLYLESFTNYNDTNAYLTLYSFSRQPYNGYAKNIYFQLPYLSICHFYTTALNNTTTHQRNTRACSINKLFNYFLLPISSPTHG